MKRYTLLLIGLFAFMGMSFAQDDTNAWFEQANTAYNSGNYDTAVVVYEKILNAGMESVPVYYKWVMPTISCTSTLWLFTAMRKP